MRISTKFTLGLGLVSSCILGGYGSWHYRQEESELKAVAERDFRILGTAVRVAVENSLRDKKTADIHEILDSLEVGEPQIDVFVLDEAGHLTADSVGQADLAESALDHITHPSARTQITNTDADSQIRFETQRHTIRLVGTFPLWGDDQTRLGAMVMVRPLQALSSDLQQTFRSTVTSSLTLIASITIVGWLLMLRYVRQPLESLNRAMRTVRDGDLNATLPAVTTDELGAMASEFNAMVRELKQARRQILDAAEAREALEQSLQQVDKLVTIGQLSAGLAHEIGSPLQVLSGRARALSARTDTPPDVRRTARILEEQSDRITRIVEQLMNFARRKVAHRIEVDLGPPIAGIVDLLKGEARRRGVELEWRDPVGLPKVTADPDQIQQVAMNLLNNALRATPRGGRIQVELASSFFNTAGGTYEQPSVALSVADSGSGIGEALQEQIFEPFFTTWSEQGGTGSGLPVVKSIVDDHGGTISFRSVQGRGTRFTVHFPTVAAARIQGRVA